MFDYLFAALTARAEVYRMLFEPRWTTAGFANREAEELLRDRRDRERAARARDCRACKESA